VNAEFIVAGEISPEVKQYLSEIFEQGFIDTIKFTGKVEDLPEFFSQCTFGLNLSRYDAWSLVVNESLLAGLSCLVSKNTGSLVIAKQVNKKLIVSEDLNEIAASMFWLYNLTPKERKKLSDKGRMISKAYSEEKAIEAFQNAFNQIIEFK